MEKNSKILVTKKSLSDQINPKKITKKSFVAHPGNILNMNLKNTKKSDSNSLKTRHSLITINSSIKENSSNCGKKRSKSKQAEYKDIKSSESRKKKINSSFQSKKPKLKKQKTLSKRRLKSPFSQKNLASVENLNSFKSPTAPSPFSSNRTPDTIKLIQKVIPILTGKKSKMPEVGYYCKRSLFDRNKSLYTESDSMIDKTINSKSNLAEYTFLSENLKEKDYEDYSSIKKTLNLENLSESPEPVESFGGLFSPNPLNQDSSIKPFDETVVKNTETDVNSLQTLENFSSPTKVIQIFSSPESKFVVSPKTNKKRIKEAFKTPKKCGFGFESPDSFVFSVSSSSSDEKIIQDGCWKNELQGCTNNCLSLDRLRKDEETQTNFEDRIRIPKN